jgi:hypothetical protein
MGSSAAGLFRTAMKLCCSQEAWRQATTRSQGCPGDQALGSGSGSFPGTASRVIRFGQERK